MADQNQLEIRDTSKSDCSDIEHEEEMNQEDQCVSQQSSSEDEIDTEYDDDGETDTEDDNAGNIGWAAALANTLQQEKPKNKKYLVLSRSNKSVEDANQATGIKSKLNFEIEDNGEIKPNVEILDIKPNSNQLEMAMIERKERRDRLAQLRVKPSVMDQDRERSFKRIATKGVVQLFNAVRTQQRDLDDRLEKAGPLDHKRDGVLNNINKRQFLDMLMGGKRAKSENVDNPVKDENEADGERPSKWSVLRDDFMTNKKLASHWNQDDDDCDAEAIANDSDSEDSH